MYVYNCTSSFSLHQLLCPPKIVNVNDVVGALHRICSMAADAHSHNLGNIGWSHIAYCRASKIVKFQFRNARFRARAFPCIAKVF
jgi:hypothetical protein